MFAAADGKVWELNSSDSRLVKAWHDKLELSIHMSERARNSAGPGNLEIPGAGKDEVTLSTVRCSVVGLDLEPWIGSLTNTCRWWQDEEESPEVFESPKQVPTERRRPSSSVHHRRRVSDIGLSRHSSDRDMNKLGKAELPTSILKVMEDVHHSNTGWKLCQLTNGLRVTFPGPSLA